MLEKLETYQQAFRDLEAVLEGETDKIAIMATMNCLLRERFPYYFWVGFYLVKNGALIVGPYQGTLGCLHIAFGRGVCGAAAASKTTQLVPDVHAFADHIACDSRSQSEIVVPVLDQRGELIAVFDVDSTDRNAFDALDQEFLEAMLQKFFAERPLD